MNEGSFFNAKVPASNPVTDRMRSLEESVVILADKNDELYRAHRTLELRTLTYIKTTTVANFVFGLVLVGAIIVRLVFFS